MKHTVNEQSIPLKLSAIRQELHRQPELSGQEFQTAGKLARWLQQLQPFILLEGIGGTGLIALFDSGKQGPTILFRSELDALPILEANQFEHRSVKEGVSHKCGHDGHMTILLGLAQAIAQKPPLRGRVLLVFQPAEEIGAGAERMLNDPRFEQILPIHFAFAVHNLPGFPMGQVVVKEGPFTASVQSLIIRLEGKTAHAGEPENGISPALAIAEILQESKRLSIPDPESPDFAILTPVHLHMGEIAYGTAAGYGEVHLTIRTWTEPAMKHLSKRLLEYLSSLATRHGLGLSTEWTDIFRATNNDANAVEQILQAAKENGMKAEWQALPFRWGEDFGAFTQRFQGALLGLGAGVHCPALHSPDYDFPDELLEPGIQLFRSLVDNILE